LLTGRSFCAQIKRCIALIKMLMVASKGQGE
jgi:hypothetical protein